jgi:tRNA(fMet)-specific endonuclease VapC
LELRLVLDTNAYSDWRRTGKWNRAISQAALVLVPTIVLGELHAGFRMGLVGRENIAKLSAFLNAAPVKVISPSERTAEIYGELVAQLKTQGTPIPTNDLWISALVLEFQALLATRDAHFRQLPQIALAVDSS